MASPFDYAWSLLKENTLRVGQPNIEPLDTVASTGEKRPKYIGGPLGYTPMGTYKQGPKTAQQISNSYRPKGPPPPEGPVGM